MKDSQLSEKQKELESKENDMRALNSKLQSLQSELDKMKSENNLLKQTKDSLMLEVDKQKTEKSAALSKIQDLEKAQVKSNGNLLVNENKPAADSPVDKKDIINVQNDILAGKLGKGKDESKDVQRQNDNNVEINGVNDSIILKEVIKKEENDNILSSFIEKKESDTQLSFKSDKNSEKSLDDIIEQKVEASKDNNESFHGVNESVVIGRK